MPEQRWPVIVVAERLGIRHGTLRNLLSRHRALFEALCGPSVYRRRFSHPRAHRYLSRREIVLVEALIRVKEKFSPA